MSDIDWPSKTTLTPLSDGRDSRGLIDPRITAYWEGPSPIVSSFQACHLLAFGGVLTPSHYLAEALWRLDRGENLGGREQAIRHGRANLDRAGVVRVYLAHRGLMAGIDRAREVLVSAAQAGQVSAFGRVGRQDHRPVSPTAFMSRDLDVFSNALVGAGGWISDLRFDVRSSFFDAAMKLFYHFTSDARPSTAERADELAETPSWQPDPGELQKQWVARPVVIAEAQRRKEAGETIKTSLGAIMGDMAKAAGSRWNADAIKKAYANAGRPTPGGRT